MASRSVLALLLVLASTLPARALELLRNDQATLDANGHLKTLVVGVFPAAHPLMPKPFGTGLLDARLKLEGSVGEWLSVAFHPVADVTLQPGGLGSGLVGLGMVQTGGVPEALPLSRTWTDQDGFTVATRVDRAAFTLRLPHLTVTAGRQPVTFGNTFFFTPMDLVAPFSPVVVDREYKPGIDAVRVDGFLGTSSKTTLVAAYAGSWDLQGLIAAARTSASLEVLDLGVFAAEVRGEPVVGMDVTGDVLGTSLRAEGTATLLKDLRTFVRLCVGADRRFESGLTLLGELYVQSLGAASPDGYLDVARSPRFRRGELWSLGRYYAALSASYEVLPILRVAFSSVANLADPSALVGPSVAWSVADEVEVVAGGNYGLGARPAEPPPDDWQLRPRSEFGLYPATSYVEVKVYY